MQYKDALRHIMIRLCASLNGPRLTGADTETLDCEHIVGGNLIR